MLFFDTLFALITSFLVHIPSPNHSNQSIYDFAFGSLLRGSISEIAGVGAGIFFNIYAISKLKIITKGKYFWLRSIGSSMIGEAILVLVSMPIMFLGTTSHNNLLSLMIFSYSYKIVFAILAATPATYIVYFLKKADNVDKYDYETNFNPFALFKKQKE